MVDLSVNKVVQFGIKETLVCKIQFVSTFIHVVILWVLFDIGFKVVPVLLLLFSQASKEVSEVFNLSLSPAFKHTFFSSFVILRIIELSGIKLLNLVEDSVKLSNCELDLVPSFVGVSSNIPLGLNFVLLHLFFSNLKGLDHRVQFLVHFCELLKFVSWVNKNTIGIVSINLDVNIGSWNSLHLSLGTISKK